MREAENQSGNRNPRAAHKKSALWIGRATCWWRRWVGWVHGYLGRCQPVYPLDARKIKPVTCQQARLFSRPRPRRSDLCRTLHTHTQETRVTDSEWTARDGRNTRGQTDCTDAHALHTSLPYLVIGVEPAWLSPPQVDQVIAIRSLAQLESVEIDPSSSSLPTKHPQASPGSQLRHTGCHTVPLTFFPTQPPTLLPAPLPRPPLPAVRLPLHCGARSSRTRIMNPLLKAGTLPLVWHCSSLQAMKSSLTLPPELRTR